MRNPFPPLEFSVPAGINGQFYLPAAQHVVYPSPRGGNRCNFTRPVCCSPIKEIIVPSCRDERKLMGIPAKASGYPHFTIQMLIMTFNLSPSDTLWTGVLHRPDLGLLGQQLGRQREHTAAPIYGIRKIHVQKIFQCPDRAVGIVNSKVMDGDDHGR